MHRTPRLILGFLLLLGAVGIAPTVRQSVPEQRFSASDKQEIDAHFASPLSRKLAVAARTRRARNVLLAQVSTATPAKPASPTVRAVFDQPDIQLKHRQMAEEVMRILPAKCQNTLQSFFVRYDNPSQRGLAGKSTLIVSGNVPDDEFRALLVHEFGHVMDLGCLQGTPQSGASPFVDGSDAIWSDDPSVSFYSISWSDAKTRRADSQAADFVSGYAQWDPFEDLAETVAAYVLHRDALKALAQNNQAIAAKVWWIETYLFPQDPAAATSPYVWQGKRPWDITKLDFTWTASLAWNN